MSPYEKQARKMKKQKGRKKQTDFTRGVMSFDSFYDEAGNFNEAAAMDENDFDEYGGDDDFWDDEYDWTETSLRHDVVGAGYNEVVEGGDTLNGDQLYDD